MLSPLTTQAAPDDVAGAEAALALIERLLAAGAARAQLAAAQGLIADVWREGAALPQSQALQLKPEQQPQQQAEEQQAEEQQPEGQQQPPVSPLHACWAALYSAALKADDAEFVLLGFDRTAAPQQQQQQQQKQQQQTQQQSLLPLTEAESAALIAAAEAAPAAGLAAALTLGLLSPYAQQQQAARARLRACELPAAAGGSHCFLPHLLCAVVFRGMFAGLAAAPPPPVPPATAGQEQAQTAAPAAVPAPRQVAFSQLCALLLDAAPHPSVAAEARAAAATAAALGLRPTPGGAGDDAAAAAAAALSAALRSDAAAAALPHAVCQLVAAGQAAAAAQLAAARVRLHPALAFLGGAALALDRYVTCLARAGAEPLRGPSSRHEAQQTPLLPGVCTALREGVAEAARGAHAQLAAATRPAAA